MTVDIHQRGELNEEIDDHGHSENVVTEFDLSAGVDDQSLVPNGSDILEEPTQTGWSMLLDRDYRIRDSSLHRELSEKLSYHLWSERGEQ